MPIDDLSNVLDLFERGETAEAVPLLEHLAGLLPTNVTTYVLLARALEAERAWDRALTAWQWAAFLMPNSPLVDRGRQRAIHALTTTRTVATTAAVDTDAVPPTPGDVDFVDLAAPEDDVAAEAPHVPGASPVADEPFLMDEPAPSEPAPSAPAPPLTTADLKAYDDLDRLIEELETARIVPQADFDPLPSPDLDDDIEDIVSETLARIYAAQGQHREAARVFELLAVQQPDRAEEFHLKAAEARSRAAG